MKATFSINHYDKDGDLLENCIRIHIDKFSMEFQNRAELDDFIANLKTISDEIAANYEPW